MTGKNEHLQLLNKTGFDIPAAGAFSKREAEMLGRFGHWMQALVTCTIPAISEQQCRFVMVDGGELGPKSDYEVA